MCVYVALRIEGNVSVGSKREEEAKQQVKVERVGRLRDANFTWGKQAISRERYGETDGRTEKRERTERPS